MDITEIKIAQKEKMRLEEQLRRAEKMEALGLMAGGVAHDMNNVLGAVVGYAELMLIGIPEESPFRRHAKAIMQSGQKAAAMIQDLLAITRRGVITSEVVNLNDEVSRYETSPEYEKLKSCYPHVDMVIRLEKDLMNIKGSPVHLGKMIMNLVSNAAESIAQDGVITLTTENRYLDTPLQGYDNMLPGDYAVLMVNDTGTGIPPEDIGKIFEPFYTKKAMGRSGTGLGLAVVWGTVKDHHGYIDVQSQEGKGTTFSLYLPVTREKAVTDSLKISIAELKDRGESILVVDDVKEQRELAEDMLGSLGYSVVSVPSGEEAVSYLASHTVDLVVLDMIMDPEIDGLATYQRILSVCPGQKAIIASGFSETEKVKKTQELGAGAYVKKPYTLEKIGIAVRTELDKE